MKVKEFADSQGITPQAVYQRLRNKAKKTGKQLSDYISDDTSEITEEGYKVLQSLYKQPVKQKESKRTVDNDRVNALSTELEKKEILIKSLETQLRDKEREISRLEESVAHERQVNRKFIFGRGYYEKTFFNVNFAWYVRFFPRCVDCLR